MVVQEKISRRAFAVAAAVTGASLAVGTASAYADDVAAGVEAADGAGSEESEGSFSVHRRESEATPAPVGEQYGFHVDTTACTGCGHCVRACAKAHGFADEAEAYRHLSAYQRADGAEVTLSSSCMHCENPACVEVCPAGALSKGAAGIVAVDHDRCIGCRYCYQACPFGVPRYTGIGMEKCDACQSVGVVPGQEPNCARSCKFDALHFGKLSDLATAYPEAKRPESSTAPAFLVQ